MVLLYAVMAAFVGGALAWAMRRLFAPRAVVSGVDLRTSDVESERRSSSASTPAQEGVGAFRTADVTSAENGIYKLAFGVVRVDYEILGDHRRVLGNVEAALNSVVSEARYFPRKPALLPKLLRAINAGNSSRNEIVRLILQDAVLAGNVLKRANSVYYNTGKQVIESIDRAVTILGNEGLRGPVASAVMQPVFQLPAGFFESFAPITWEHARRTAVAAEEIARLQRSSDAFVAHLVGMLEGLGRIVLFRLAMDKYREHGNLMPRPEVFIRVMTDHSRKIARAIASAWEMSPVFIEALEAQIAETPPTQMTPLARTLYSANLFGTFATLHKHNAFSEDDAKRLLRASGANEDHLEAVWKAASDDELS